MDILSLQDIILHKKNTYLPVPPIIVEGNGGGREGSEGGPPQP